jgi:mono/diheme cytochrome c family protein
MSLSGEASVSVEQMPEGWWLDPKVIEEGGKIYEGLVNPDVVCGACHGSEGPPLMEGARDFRDKAYMDSKTDKELFDAVTNGVTRNGEPTPMTAWGEMINPGQRWKVLAYIFNKFTGGRKDLGVAGGGQAKKEKEIWRPWPWG